MNGQAHYVYFTSPSKVYGPFLNEVSARKYAGNRGTVTRLTGNEILRYNVKVTGL